LTRIDPTQAKSGIGDNSAVPSERKDKLAWAIAAGIVAASLIGLLSVRGLIRASDLQDRLNRGHALVTVSQRLAPLTAQPAGEILNEQVRDLVRLAGLGFTHLILRDAQGTVLATEGRFERLSIPFMSQLTRQRLRTWLYAVTSDSGLLELQHAGQRVGQVEYELAPALANDVREDAIGELRIVAWIGLLLALPTLAALGMVVLRWPVTTPPGLLARSRQVVQRIERLEADPEDAEAEVALVNDVLHQHGVQALDQLKRGLIVVDRDARIRFMNRTAAEITGWSVDDARGRLVYSVFHPLDDQQAPLVTPAETCLREGREYEPAELWVRSRNASVSAVEVMAALLRDRPGTPPTGAAMVFHVIDDRRDLIEQLKRQSRLSLGVIDHLVEGVLTTDTSGVIGFANARALRMFGYARDELEGVTITRLMPVPFLNTPGLHLTDYIGGRHQSRLPKVVGWRKDATTFPLELVVQPMNVEGAEGLVVIARDITERLRSDNLAQRLGRLLDAAAEEVYIFDAQSLYFVEVNRGARRNLGYQPSEINRLSMLGISHELESETFLSHLARLRGGEVDHITYRCKHVRADGSEYPVEVRLNFSREEEPPMFMAIAVDVTEREAQEDRLRHLAQHDPLTGLPNRATLLDRLRQAVLTASRSSRLVGVFFIDLDRFKHVNDTYGHEIGDVVLELSAKRLSAALRETDTVARLGGDEFVVVAQGLRGLDDAEVLARKLLEGFVPRFEIPEHDVRVTPSVGISIYPLDDTDAEGLLRHADAAMYQAKQSGLGQYRVYSMEVPPEKRRRLELERGLHAAIALQQFEVEAIPVFELVGSPEPLGALMLDFWWRHPRQGRIISRDVMSAAGRAGLLGDVELWMIHRACALLPPVAALSPDVPAGADAPPLPVIVNISAWQLKDPDFSLHVFELMERHDVPPRRLVFALNSQSVEELRETPPPLVRRLLERGVRFALHGAAEPLFAALNLATSLPIDLVVLEPDEVSRTPQDAQATERLRLALLSAKNLGLPVLAKGVSSVEAREWLVSQGCKLGAGSQFASPVAAEALNSWLLQREAAPL
jgi:diguanylate cyclase (GGDEF)-like protein/PAS domain S-box-containing protein